MAHDSGDRSFLKGGDSRKPSSAMKVAALTSGGKDSCLAAWEAEEAGHTVICLACATPEEAREEGDLSCQMFQTAGHALLPALARCAGLPLIRVESLKSTMGDADEQATLTALATECAKMGAEALVSGAVLSDYQRVRVERACKKAGITSLAPLWRRPQEDVVASITGREMRAILVRVASLGLEPHRHLGSDLLVMQPLLAKLADRYGVHQAGEGGEYETVVLDSEGPLHRYGWIDISSSSTIAGTSEEGHLVVHDHRVVPKGHSDAVAANDNTPIVDVDAQSALREYGEDNLAEEEAGETVVQESAPGRNLVCIRAGPDSAQSTSCAKQMEDALEALERELAPFGGWNSCLMIHLFVGDMRAFEEVNAVYKQHVPQRFSPARSCVQTLLPSGHSIKAHALAARRDKRVLHVESVSKWAPASIGPYAQANSLGCACFIAGQIGLDPFTMQLVAGGPGKEAEQAVSNCAAVANAMGFHFPGGAAHVIVWALAEDDAEAAALAVLSGFDDACASDWQRAAPVVVVALVEALPRGARVELEPICVPDGALCWVREIDGEWRDSCVTSRTVEVKRAFVTESSEGDASMGEPGVVRAHCKQVGVLQFDSGEIKWKGEVWLGIDLALGEEGR